MGWWGRLKGVMTFVSTWCRPGVEMFEGEIALQTWIQELELVYLGSKEKRGRPDGVLFCHPWNFHFLLCARGSLLAHQSLIVPKSGLANYLQMTSRSFDVTSLISRPCYENNVLSI